MMHTLLYVVTLLVGDIGKQQCAIIPVVFTSVFIPPWVRSASSELEGWNLPSGVSLFVSGGGRSFLYICNSKWERMFQHRQKLTRIAY